MEGGGTGGAEQGVKVEWRVSANGQREDSTCFRKSGRVFDRRRGAPSGHEADWYWCKLLTLLDLIYIPVSRFPNLFPKPILFHIYIRAISKDQKRKEKKGLA